MPYKGVGPMVSDLIGGQIDFATVALSSVQGQIAGGKLRAIGTATSKRIEGAPDIPTFVEQGLPGFRGRSLVPATGAQGHVIR